MSPVFVRPVVWIRLVAGLAAAFLWFGCSSTTPTAHPGRPAIAPPVQPQERIHPVMLGIDVLESDGFAAVKGRRVGLLTHPAGVNRQGVSTIEVLRRAPQVQLVALYAVEHGLHGKLPASQKYGDGVDTATRLPLFSLYNGRTRKPTPEQLRPIDVLVIDLQDIGARSYTFISAMKVALEACFEQGKEVVVLDRPNPLGGLKVDGPPLDAELMTYVGAFRVPYIHGLTIGELALVAKGTPGVLSVPEAVRTRGRLTVVPMRGWRRTMRWPETGLTFVPTSPYVRDFGAVTGYAMTGLGCEIGGFTHGLGTVYPFRALSFPRKSPEELERALEALRLPGVAFRVVGTTAADGRTERKVYVEVTDWVAWRPTELSLHMMRLAAAWNPRNPFATAKPAEVSSFNNHVGSMAWWRALSRDGARVNVPAYVAEWQQRAQAYQQNVRRFWLYAP